MINLFDIGGSLGIKTEGFDRGLQGSGVAADKTFASMYQSAKRYLGATGLLWSFKKINDQSMAFGQMMADLSAITELSINKMSKSLMQLDNVLGKPLSTGFTLYETISSGIKGTEKDLIHFVETAGKTAKTIRADTYTTSSAMTTMMHAYGISAAESTKLLDFFYAAVKEGKIHGNEFARTLGLVVNNAAETGVKVNELGAALATLSRTMTASNATISLNQMMNSFLGPTAEAIRVAKQYGIQMDVETIRTKGFAAVMKDVHDKVGGNVVALKSLFGNIRASRGALVLTGSQFKNFIDVLEEFENASGRGEKAFEKQTQTTAAAFQRMQTAVNKAAITMGSDFDGISKSVFKVGEAVADGFRNADHAISELMETLGASVDGPMVKFVKSWEDMLQGASRYGLYLIGINHIWKQIGGAVSVAAKASAILTGGMGKNAPIMGADLRVGPKGVPPIVRVGGLPTSTKETAESSVAPLSAAASLETKKLEATFRETSGLLKSLVKKVEDSNAKLFDAVAQADGVASELSTFNRAGKAILKKFDKINGNVMSVSDSVSAASDALTTSGKLAIRLRAKLIAFSDKYKILTDSVDGSSSEVSKAATASKKGHAKIMKLLGNLNMLATTTAESLGSIVDSVKKTNSAFGRAVKYASQVNADVIVLESRLRDLHLALTGKYPSKVSQTSKVLKEQSKAAGGVVVANPAPMPPSIKNVPVSQLMMAYEASKRLPPGFEGAPMPPKAPIIVTQPSPATPSVSATTKPIPVKVTEVVKPSLKDQPPSIKNVPVSQLMMAYEASKRLPPGFEGAPARGRFDMSFLDRKLLPAPASVNQMIARTMLNGYALGPRGSGAASAVVLGGVQASTFGDARLVSGVDSFASASKTLKVELKELSGTSKEAAEAIRKQIKQNKEISALRNPAFSNARLAAEAGSGVGQMISIVGRWGLGIFGSFSAAQMGWAIGKQIAEKFKFSETRLFRAIGDALAGKLGTGTKEQERQIDSYNVGRLGKSAQARIERLSAAGTIGRLEADRFMRELSRAYIDPDGADRIKRLLDRIYAVEQDRMGAVASYTTTIEEANKRLKEAMEEADVIKKRMASEARRTSYTETEKVGVLERVRSLYPNLDWTNSEFQGIKYKKPVNRVMRSAAAALTGMVEKGRRPGADEVLKLFQLEGRSVIDSYTFMDIMDALNPGSPNQQEEQARLDDATKEVGRARSNLVTSIAIKMSEVITEEAGKIETDQIMAEIGETLSGGLDSTKLAALKAASKEGIFGRKLAEFLTLQSVFKKIIDDMTATGASADEIRTTSATIRESLAAAYPRMLDSWQESINASTKAAEAEVERLSKQTEGRLGETLFTPAENMTVQLYKDTLDALNDELTSVVKAIDSISQDREKLRNMSIDQIRKITEESIDNEIARIEKELKSGDMSNDEAERQTRVLKAQREGVQTQSLVNLIKQQSGGYDAQLDVFEGRKEAIQKRIFEAGQGFIGQARSAAESRVRGVGYQRDLGMITETQYISQMHDAYAKLIPVLMKARSEYKDGSDGYRGLTDEIIQTRIKMKELKDSAGDAAREQRNALLGSVQGMFSGGKADNNAMKHAIQIMGMASGPVMLRRLTAPSMTINGPYTINKAQQAQSALAASMDSYINSQRYENANVGKTVAKIYDFISKNNAIVLR